MLFPALAAVAVALAGLTETIDQQPNWAAALRQDAQAFHDEVEASHPGPVNALDPGFSRRNDAALAVALRRSEQVTDQAGYTYALWSYSAAFDDGHVGASPMPDLPPLPVKWPGFLTGFNDVGDQVVMTREDSAPVPVGARLISCDGRAADRLAAENVGAFVGRWMLLARRITLGGQLFGDYGNPFVTRPFSCVFEIDGRARTVALDWQPIDPAAFRQRRNETTRVGRDPIGSRTLPDGTRWFTLSGFNGDPDGVDAKALNPLIAAMAADRDAILAAPRIVLDLRGNRGGSSAWSARIARILWGQARVDSLPNRSYVEWRVSPANLAAMRTYQTRFDRPETDDATKAYFRMIVDGLEGAASQGQALWRQPSGEETQPDTETPTTPAPTLPPVYFITDIGCASACLDAADLWKALGAIQVGQETGADTLYMDVRTMDLPSGLGQAAVPMKVYRGRARGSNEPLSPVHPYRGDMRDTAALEAWVTALRN